MAKEELYPTVAFGFAPIKGKMMLHQMWVDQWGNVEWKPVPMIEPKKGMRSDSIAGFVPEEDEPADE
jgi:hypothetical protein